MALLCDCYSIHTMYGSRPINLHTCTSHRSPLSAASTNRRFVIETQLDYLVVCKLTCANIC
jgi:hypothetical protein